MIRYQDCVLVTSTSGIRIVQFCYTNKNKESTIRFADGKPLELRQSSNLTPPAKQKAPIAKERCSLFGAGGEIRTLDLLITNQLHYPCATPA